MTQPKFIRYNCAVIRYSPVKMEGNSAEFNGRERVDTYACKCLL